MRRTAYMLAIVFITTFTLRAISDEPPPRSLRLREAPEFTNVTRWINSEPLTIEGLRGKVVVVHFWTNGCFNCVNNYPHYRAWQERYAAKDVVFIGIHSPETASERDIQQIKDQAVKHGLKFPIAVDNDGSNWQSWKNQVWPTVYVVDRKGMVRYGWEGELSYRGAKGEETIRKWIDLLLEEKTVGRDR